MTTTNSSSARLLPVTASAMAEIVAGIGWVPRTLSTSSFNGHGVSRPSAISVAAMPSSTAMRPRYGRMHDHVQATSEPCFAMLGRLPGHDDGRRRAKRDDRRRSPERFRRWRRDGRQLVWSLFVDVHRGDGAAVVGDIQPAARTHREARWRRDLLETGHGGNAAIDAHHADAVVSVVGDIEHHVAPHRNHRDAGGTGETR